MKKIVVVLILLLVSVSVYGQHFLIQPKTLDSVLKANGVAYHKEFTYLAFCESGLQNKNLFGMHHPYSRKTYSVARYGQAAKFLCIEDGIKDFLIWYNIAVPDIEELFITFLRRRAYNPNPNYYLFLDNVIKKNKLNL